MKLNGDKLRDARDAKRLLQADAAAEIGVSIATLSNAENGDDIRLSSAELICNFYGLELQDARVPRVKEEEDHSAA